MKAKEVIMRGLAKHCWDDDWEAYEEEADALLEAFQAAGLVVVPREPTEAMMDRGGDVIVESDRFFDYADGTAGNVYRAMIQEADNG